MHGTVFELFSLMLFAIGRLLMHKNFDVEACMIRVSLLILTFVWCHSFHAVFRLPAEYNRFNILCNS
jgi:hypothetical protein